MKVKELIEQLSKHDPNAEVAFWGYNFYETSAYIEKVYKKDNEVWLEE